MYQHQQTCPTCGSCPTCGRAAFRPGFQTWGGLPNWITWGGSTGTAIANGGLTVGQQTVTTNTGNAQGE